MATYFQDVQQALEDLGGTARLREIYAAVRRIRPGPLPKSFEAIIRKTLEHHSSDSDNFNGTDDVFFSANGIRGGVWGLRGFSPAPPLAVDLNVEGPDRVNVEIYRIIRDTKMIRTIKQLHRNRCQLCGMAVELGAGITYSEGHHIKPLGSQHEGPDISENILILCPNHHAQCDFGAIRLSLSSIRLHPDHAVSSEFIDYHNRHVYKECSQPF